MGVSNGNFIKYPRTPHLYGSTGTDDDKHLGPASSNEFLNDDSLIVEEKLDGTNVGLHFSNGELVLQCRGHLITVGMHPQYDLFKQWATAQHHHLLEILGVRFILFGEWVYAKHSIFYQQLSHYFFEFDIYDKEVDEFLDYPTRMEVLSGSSIQTVPVVHHGPLRQSELKKLIGPSKFDARFNNPATGEIDDLCEGIYLRTESGGYVTRRAKFVRPEFAERVKLSSHWQHQEMIVNQLANGVDLWE